MDQRKRNVVFPTCAFKRRWRIKNEPVQIKRSQAGLFSVAIKFHNKKESSNSNAAVKFIHLPPGTLSKFHIDLRNKLATHTSNERTQRRVCNLVQSYLETKILELPIHHPYPSSLSIKRVQNPAWKKSGLLLATLWFPRDKQKGRGIKEEMRGVPGEAFSRGSRFHHRLVKTHRSRAGSVRWRVGNAVNEQPLPLKGLRRTPWLPPFSSSSGQRSCTSLVPVVSLPRRGGSLYEGTFQASL